MLHDAKTYLRWHLRLLHPLADSDANVLGGASRKRVHAGHPIL